MAISTLLRGNALVSRLKGLLIFQRFTHTLEQAGSAQASFYNDMDSDSLFVQGRFDSAKWRKVDSRTLGITGSMISSPSWIVLKILRREGFEAYLVGGCVRDLILNKKPKDFDVITTAALKQIRKKFYRAEIVGRRFPICRVHVRGSVVEVSSFETVAQHEVEKGKKFFSQMPLCCDGKDLLLWRNSMHRDFTINSLFFDPFVNKIYDYANGMMDLRSLKLQTLIPAQLSFKEDSARILRGLRIAARLGLSFSKETEIAMHKLSSSVGSLAKSRIMMELNYMLSYGAAEPSLCLLRRFNLLEILLPFHAAYFSEQASYPSGQCPIMLMKLFFYLDQLVACDRPSDCSLWVGLLAFHLALVKNPQHSLVVLTFASVLYHGKWEKGVEYARQHAKASISFVPEILGNFDFISDDELAKKVTQLALLVQESVAVLTETDSLIETMARFPGFPCSGLVFISKRIGKGVAEIFDGLVRRVETYVTQKENIEIDYDLLGKGNLEETRFTLGKIIIDTLGCGAVCGDEVMEEKDHPLCLDRELKVQVFEGNCKTPFNLEISLTMEKDDKKRMMLQTNSELEQEAIKRQKLVQKKTKISVLEIKKLNAAFSKRPKEVGKKKQDKNENRVAAVKHKKVVTEENGCSLQEGKRQKNETCQLLQESVLESKECQIRRQELTIMKQRVGENEIMQERAKEHLLELDQCQISQNEETERQKKSESKIHLPQVVISRQEGILDSRSHLNQHRIVARKNGNSKQKKVKDKSSRQTLSSLFR